MSKTPRPPNDLCHCARGDFNCEELVRRHLAGDRDAGNELASKFQGLIQATVKKRIRADQRQDYEDCAQALMMKVFGKTSDGRFRLQDWLDRPDRGPFCYWILAVTVRHVIDWNAKPIGPMDGLEEFDPVAPIQEPDLEPGPMATIFEFLGQAAPKYQKLFRLRHDQHLEWKEIALELGVIDKTAYNWNKELKHLFLKVLAQKGFDILVASVLRRLLDNDTSSNA